MRRNGLMWVPAATCTLSILLSGCSKQDSTRRPSPKQSPGPSSAVGTGGAGANLKSDDDFVRDIAIKNMAEVELSRMALDKATNPNIKTFAQQMIDEHGAAGNKLKSVVSGQPMEWPAQLDAKYKKKADELGKKQGPDFDREYVEAMIESHQDLAAKLESRLDVQSVADWKTAAADRVSHSQSLSDPKGAMSDVPIRPAKGDKDVTVKINQWAADTYPVAQKHLDVARALENATKKRSTN